MIGHSSIAGDDLASRILAEQRAAAGYAMAGLEANPQPPSLAEFDLADLQLAHGEHSRLGDGGEPLGYRRGTRILTPTGEVEVETLRAGDQIVTRFAGIREVKHIGRQAWDGRSGQDDPTGLPVRIRAGALLRGMPARDLWVAPAHAMLVDGVLVRAGALVNGVTIAHECPAPDPARLEFYRPEFFCIEFFRPEFFRIELESHDCIIAEGCWSETWADAAALCAPRAESGAALDAVLRPVVAGASAGIAPGRLEGFIDRGAGHEIDGWAFDADHPDLPVLLDILLDGAVIHTTLACAFRADLMAAGLGLGRCAFYATLAEPLPPDWSDRVQIRRAADGALLPMSETCQAPDGVFMAA